MSSADSVLLWWEEAAATDALLQMLEGLTDLSGSVDWTGFSCFGLVEQEHFGLLVRKKKNHQK